MGSISNATKTKNNIPEKKKEPPSKTQAHLLVKFTTYSGYDSNLKLLYRKAQKPILIRFMVVITLIKYGKENRG